MTRTELISLVNSAHVLRFALFKLSVIIGKLQRFRSFDESLSVAQLSYVKFCRGSCRWSFFIILLLFTLDNDNFLKDQPFFLLPCLFVTGVSAKD